MRRHGVGGTGNSLSGVGRELSVSEPTVWSGAVGAAAFFSLYLAADVQRATLDSLGSGGAFAIRCVSVAETESLLVCVSDRNRQLVSYPPGGNAGFCCGDAGVRSGDPADLQRHSSGGPHIARTVDWRAAGDRVGHRFRAGAHGWNVRACQRVFFRARRWADSAPDC